MSRWSRGEADVEQLLRNGQLQHVTGAAANGGPWLIKASATVTTAEAIASADPASAYTLAYDAARFACVGEAIEADEAREAVRNARMLIESAGRLADHLGLF